MDDFTRSGMKFIGIGGLHCPCCNPFKTFGNHSRKRMNFSKLRRTKLKESLNKDLKELGDEND